MTKQKIRMTKEQATFFSFNLGYEVARVGDGFILLP